MQLFTITSNTVCVYSITICKHKYTILYSLKALVVNWSVDGMPYTCTFASFPAIPVSLPAALNLASLVPRLKP